MVEERPFAGDVVVVTGAANGLGRSHALLLSRLGARVVVNDIGLSLDRTASDASAAQAVVDEIVAEGGEAVASTDAVGSEASAQAIVSTALDAFGRVDGLVHNAGVSSHVPLDQLSWREWETVRRVHLDGGFTLAHAVWPHMKARGYGRIVMITSGAGTRGTANLSHYGAAKAGLVGFVKCIALEGRSFGINVNALAVAAMTRSTERLHRLAGNTEVAEWWSTYLRPELTSPMVAWLVHPTCEMTGEVFNARGGHVSLDVHLTTRGYTNPELTMEDVAAHLEEIIDTSGASVVSGRGGSRLDGAGLGPIVEAGAAPYPTPAKAPVIDDRGGA